MDSDIFIPYAVICDEFLESADGTVTITRIIETIECVEKSGPLFRRRGDLPVLRTKYAVCFKSAVPITGLQTELRCTRPSGKQFIVGTKTVDLTGNYRGTLLSGELSFRLEEDGWHIFDVLVGGLGKARMVLNVSIQRLSFKEKLGIGSGKRKSVPPTQSTFGHPKCYARALGNCSKILSREHYISKSFLTELNLSGGLRVGGLPWQKPEEVCAISPNALAGNILCKDHNSRLGKLDDLAGPFFKALNAIHAACTDGRRLPNDSRLEIDGNHFERVLLKILLGGLASGNLRGPGGTLFGTDLDLPILEVLFGEKEFPPSTGMFLLGQLNEPWGVERHIEVAAVVAAEQPVAVIVNIAPLRFALTVTPEGKNVAVIAGKSFFRPATINILGPNNSSHKILFKWTGESGNQDIAINYLDTPPR